jgi:rod shape-determining protein MreC
MALSLTLAAADHAGPAGPAIERLRGTIRGGLAHADGAATHPLAAVAVALGRADDLARENARLRRDLARQRSRATWADALARDNVALASLNGLSAPGGIPGIAARVVAGPVGLAGSGLLLDRGTEAGIHSGMPVVAGGALIGRVQSASPGRAAVLPVVDPAVAVGVRLADSGQVGWARGSGRRLRLQLLDPQVAAAAGTLVVTAGLAHGRYPPALPVGHVGRDGRTVEPLIPVTALETVQVLAWEAEG